MSTPVAEDMSNGHLPEVPPADQPLARPPPGQTANLDHPVSHSYEVYVTAAVCIPLILIFATLRIYNVIWIRRFRTPDDYTFMLATVCTIIWICLVIALLTKGLFGTHIWDLTLGDLRNTPFLMVLLLESLWGPFVFFIKLSLFQLYLYLFKSLRWLKHLVWAGITVTGLFYSTDTVAKIALCAPRGNQTYIMSFSSPSCHNSKALAVVTGVFNIISDLYLLVIPVPAILRLHTTPRRKTGTLAIFGTGIM